MISIGSLLSKSNFSYAKYIDQYTKSQQPEFIGPQALFDPNFIPPVTFLRKKQSLLLQGIIKDALEDEFSTNVNFYGLTGIGKNLHINHFLNWMILLNHKLNMDEQFPNALFHILKIDCEEKDLQQIIFSMILHLAQQMNLSLDFQQIMLLDSHALWNSFKILVQKAETPIICYFNHSEYLESHFLSKIFVFAKRSRNFQILTSINTGLRTYSFKNYRAMDHRIQLDQYSTHELWKITQQRGRMAFEYPLDSEVYDNILSYITDYAMKVPGSCVKFLQELNPYIQQNNEISPENLREIAQYHFDSIQFDSLHVAETLMETTIEDRLFLDYLINHFQNQDRYFIYESDVHGAFQMTYEELGYVPDQGEYDLRLHNVLNTNLISMSRIFIPKGKKYFDQSQKKYYLAIPVAEANDLMELSFGGNF